jgi:hypothetical protein
MDSGTTITGAIITALCIVPFAIIHYKKVKEENNKLHSLKQFASQHNCKISKHEFCGDFVIGLDEIRNFVFLYKGNKGKITSQFMNLNEIQICKAEKSTRSINSKEPNMVITERISLRFIPANSSKRETKFELYNEETNPMLNGEIALVDNWAKKINDQLKNKN